MHLKIYYSGFEAKQAEKTNKQLSTLHRSVFFVRYLE